MPVRNTTCLYSVSTSLRPALGSSADRRARTLKIIRILKKEYPEAACALRHRDPFELLVGTILSAQCTDKRVNLTTPALFARYRTPQDFAAANQDELEEIIRPTGFFRNKARNLIACCRKLLELHDGNVPRSISKLTALPGVGRKTANVVLSSGYGIAEGIVVDTHVLRLSRLLGLTTHADPVKIEFDLLELVPLKDRTVFAHLLYSHGRAVCVARRPRCGECVLRKLCPSRRQAAAGKPKRTRGG